jgi:hypothetical protein
MDRLLGLGGINTWPFSQGDLQVFDASGDGVSRAYQRSRTGPGSHGDAGAGDTQFRQAWEICRGCWSTSDAVAASASSHRSPLPVRVQPRDVLM